MFFALCQELGLEEAVASSRFSTYRELLLELIQVVDQTKADDVAGHIRTKVLRRMPQYVVGLTESREVGESLPFLHTCRPEAIIGRIRRVLAGPIMPEDENPASNQSRNILFEFVLAATLWGAGVPVALAEPDLRYTFSDRTVFIACKRMFSMEKLVRRINEATRQLDRRLRTEPEVSRGVVAISLSKVMNPGKRLETVANQSQARALLATRIETLVMKRARWQACREAEAILFHAASPFSNLDSGRIEAGEFFVLFGDNPTAKAVAEALNRAAHW